MMCKKLRHALMYSKVITKNIPNAAIIEFVQSKGDISDAIVDKKELVQYLLS